MAPAPGAPSSHGASTRAFSQDPEPMHKIARWLPVGLAAVSCLVLLSSPRPTRSAPPVPPLVAYLASATLPDRALVSLGAAVAARPGAVLLLDSPGLSPSLRRFLAEFGAERVVPVGDFAEGQAGLKQRLGVA